MSDFKVNEFGEIVRNGVVSVGKKTSEEEIYEEYQKLVYDLSHPERFSIEEYEQKKKRRIEIEQSGADIGNKNAVAFEIAKRKMQNKGKKTDNSALLAGIARFKKQND